MKVFVLRLFILLSVTSSALAQVSTESVLEVVLGFGATAQANRSQVYNSVENVSSRKSLLALKFNNATVDESSNTVRYDFIRPEDKNADSSNQMCWLHVQFDLPMESSINAAVSNVESKIICEPIGD